MPNLREKILILADDLTGALDSGVQLVGRGLSAVVLPDWHAAFSEEEEDCSVVVVNTESRHMEGSAAADIVRKLVIRAGRDGASRIYKKTDSGLRGNPGAELSAALSAAGSRRIHFIPAYPDAGRQTRNGIQYVNGVPLAQSIFAKDPIEPMTESSVEKILRRETDAEIHSISRDGLQDAAKKTGILIYDAETNEDLETIAAFLKERGELLLTAGCAGFLEYMPFVLEKKKAKGLPKLPDRLLVVSGSKNAVTGQQLDAAEAAGAARRHVPVGKVLAGSWTSTDRSAFVQETLAAFSEKSIGIIDTLQEVDLGTLPPMDSNEIGQRIASQMGELLAEYTRSGEGRALMVIGGDTLQGFIRALSIQKLYPVAQLDTGVVLASFGYSGTRRYVITKSGAFGTADQISRLQKKLSDMQAGAETQTV